MTINRSIDVDSIRVRIAEMVEQLELKPAAFADKTSLPRTTVSNILNGKTNATIVVINKILLAFPDWSAAWLLFGIGFRKGYDPLATAPSQRTQPNDLFDSTPHTEVTAKSNEQPSTGDGCPSMQASSLCSTTATVIQLPTKEIEKILVFYSDSSYQAFYPEKS